MFLFNDAGESNLLVPRACVRTLSSTSQRAVALFELGSMFLQTLTGTKVLERTKSKAMSLSTFRCCRRTGTSATNTKLECPSPKQRALVPKTLFDLSVHVRCSCRRLPNWSVIGHNTTSTDGAPSCGDLLRQHDDRVLELGQLRHEKNPHRRRRLRLENRTSSKHNNRNRQLLTLNSVGSTEPSLLRRKYWQQPATLCRNCGVIRAVTMTSLPSLL